jgi:hypothetical protein
VTATERDGGGVLGGGDVEAEERKWEMKLQNFEVLFI